MHIYQFKKEHFKTKKQNTPERQRCDSVTLQLTPFQRVGRITEKYYWEQEIC
jgi:hypothetical protein